MNIYKIASYAILAVMLLVFGYGMIRFPDSPVHPCAEHGYCGKQGQPHSQEDFESFSSWQTSLFIIWPAGMLGLFLLKGKSGR